MYTDTKLQLRTSPSIYSHRWPGFPAARNSSQLNAVFVAMLPPTALLPQESSLRFPYVQKSRPQGLRQPALDFGCDQTRCVETPYMYTVLVAIRAQLHPKQVSNRDHRNLTSLTPLALGRQLRIRDRLTGRDPLAGEKQRDGVDSLAAVKKHIQAGRMTKPEALRFCRRNNPLEIGTANQDIPVSRPRPTLETFLFPALPGGRSRCPLRTLAGDPRPYVLHDSAVQPYWPYCPHSPIIFANRSNRYAASCGPGDASG